MEPDTTSQTPSIVGAHPSIMQESPIQSNVARMRSSRGDLNIISSGSNTTGEVTNPASRLPPLQEDQQQDVRSRIAQIRTENPHETEVDSYTNWLPQNGNVGLLLRLQLFATFFLVGLFVLLVTPMSFFVYSREGRHIKILVWSLPSYIVVDIMQGFLGLGKGMLFWEGLGSLVVFCFSKPSIGKDLGGYSKIILCSAWIGLLCWGNYSLSIMGDTFSVWSVVNLPNTFHACQTRVADQQSGLFVPGYQNSTHLEIFDRGTYHAQFDRIWATLHDGIFTSRSINSTLFHEIQTNPVLCGTGFRGNSDYYGVGIRSGLYLQWLASLLANNFLPQSRTALQTVYLAFSLAICLTTIVTTFTRTCTFGIEIEILYWMYWGGYICVFGSSPEIVVRQEQGEWVQLHWTTVVLFVQHWIMAYHGAWYIWYGYDHSFARFPCGTYHFFIAPLLDPSETYGNVRDFLMATTSPLVGAMVLIFPLLTILMAAELKHSILESPVFRIFFPNYIVRLNHENPTERRRGCLFSKLYRTLKNVYRQVRRLARLPPHSRKGIRLITPLDIQERRRHRIVYGLMGTAGFSLSIAAIELTLKWNKIMDVNDLAPTGQQISLIIGAGSFISVIWSLVRQESERQLSARLQRTLQQANGEGIELEVSPASFSETVTHAFAQREVEVLRSGSS